MKIDSASYSLQSSHLATRRDEAQESLRIWTGNRRPDFDAGASAGTSAVSLSSAAFAAFAASLPPGVAPAAQVAPQPPTTGSGAIEDATEAITNDPFLQLLISMVEMLTGRAIRVFSMRDMRRQEAPPAVGDPHATAPQQSAPARPAGFGIEYDYHAVHEEYEQTQVSAEGIIKTGDGREISFSLELSMTRRYREESSVSIRAGDAIRKDPLVLNFNGTAAQLSDRRFAFDLDSDGTTENVALLAPGSGYLAIDRNGNDRIDSGSELFGPATHSGFKELAALDSDGNGWIDESDSAFTALRIWTPDTDGKGTLETLVQRRVGAIALGNVTSPFELRGAANSDLGAILASGLFLAEDGRLGSVQEIDLTV